MKTFTMILWLVLLSGCASMNEDYRKATCNYSGAYEKGVNDAQSGQPSIAQKLVYFCGDDSKDEIARGYREGYMTIKQTPMININTNGVASFHRCEARPGNEAHQTFCANLDRMACGVHSLCVYR